MLLSSLNRLFVHYKEKKWNILLKSCNRDLLKLELVYLECYSLQDWVVTWV